MTTQETSPYCNHINPDTEPVVSAQQQPQPVASPALPVPEQQPVLTTAPPPRLPQPETAYQPQQVLEPLLDWPPAVEPHSAPLPQLMVPS